MTSVALIAGENTAPAAIQDIIHLLEKIRSFQTLRAESSSLQSEFALIKQVGDSLQSPPQDAQTGYDNLHQALHRLCDCLRRYYDREGCLRRRSKTHPVRECLSFLDPKDLTTIETFARDEIDPWIETRSFGDGARGTSTGSWIDASFTQMCRVLYHRSSGRSRASREALSEFSAVMSEQSLRWRTLWGYKTAHLNPSSPRHTDLLRHCLKLHCREILYQLLVSSSPSSSVGRQRQDTTDQQQMHHILRMLMQTYRRLELVNFQNRTLPPGSHR